MAKFTLRLENVIKADIKDESAKTENMLRSHSNYMDMLMSPASNKEHDVSPKAGNTLQGYGEDLGKFVINVNDSA
jgi:hypothetical protein